MIKAFSAIAVLATALLVGCSTTASSPDVTGSLRDSLKQAGLKDVAVSQDREKSVVTLKGSVTNDGDKMRGRIHREVLGRKPGHRE